MNRVPITSPLAVLTTRTTLEHLMTTHSTTDLKPGDFAEHPGKGRGVVYNNGLDQLSVMHRSVSGRVHTSSDLDGWKRVETCTSRERQWLDYRGGVHCICDPNPETTNGPEEDCEIHGRPYADWVKRAAELQEELDRVKGTPADDEAKPMSATVTLYCPDCGGAENVTVVMLGRQSNGERWFDLREFHAHTCPPAQPDEPTEFGSRIVVTDDLSGKAERWCRQHDEYWASENGALMTWAYLTQRGPVTLGWDDGEQP